MNEDQEIRDRIEALEYRLTQLNRINRERELEEDVQMAEEEAAAWSVENPLTGKGPRSKA